MSSPWKDFPNNKTERPFEGIPAGQEPEVMLGFTAPATDPWPPLSREQVVELHEALRAFQEDWALSMRLWGAMMDLKQRGAAARLSLALNGLGIGTPPQSRRWTNDDIQAALEKHERELLDRVGLPKHVLSPGPASATEIALLSAMEARRMQGAWEEPTASLVSSPLGEVRHNCWTCKHNLTGVGAWGCSSQEMGTVRWLSQMANELLPQDDGSRMPSKLSNGCPGWEPTP